MSYTTRFIVQTQNHDGGTEDGTRAIPLTWWSGRHSNKQTAQAAPTARSIWVIKHKHSTCVTEKYEMLEVPPRGKMSEMCGNHQEASLHVNNCEAPQAIIAWEKSLQLIENGRLKIQHVIYCRKLEKPQIASQPAFLICILVYYLSTTTVKVSNFNVILLQLDRAGPSLFSERVPIH
jgi:hypothetical protein